MRGRGRWQWDPAWCPAPLSELASTPQEVRRPRARPRADATTSRCPGCPPRPCLVTPGLPGPWWNCWGALRILPEWVGLGGRTEPVTVVGLPREGWGVLSGLSVGPEHPECSTVSCGVLGGHRAFLEATAIADQDPGILFLASLWSPHPFGPWWGQEGRALALTLAWHAVSDTMATPRKARVDQVDAAASPRPFQHWEKSSWIQHTGTLPSGVQVLTARPASGWTWQSPELLLECGRPAWGGGRSWVPGGCPASGLQCSLGALQLPQGARPACGPQRGPGAALPHVSPSLSLALPWLAPWKGGGGRQPGASAPAPQTRPCPTRTRLCQRLQTPAGLRTPGLGPFPSHPVCGTSW